MHGPGHPVFKNALQLAPLARGFGGHLRSQLGRPAAGLGQLGLRRRLGFALHGNALVDQGLKGLAALGLGTVKGTQAGLPNLLRRVAYGITQRGDGGLGFCSAGFLCRFGHGASPSVEGLGRGV